MILQPQRLVGQLLADAYAEDTVTCHSYTTTYNTFASYYTAPKRHTEYGQGPDMNRDIGVGGRWTGSHVISCQRERCQNPKDNLINCFSCQRAFCRPCWKKVLKMLPGVKRAKGFQNCSIGPRPQIPTSLLSEPIAHFESQRSSRPSNDGNYKPFDNTESVDKEPRPRSNAKPARPTNSLRYPPIQQREYISLTSDSDDSENEVPDQRCASKGPNHGISPSNIQHSGKQQQNEPSLQSHKRSFEDSFVDLENGIAKSRKLTSSIPPRPHCAQQDRHSQITSSLMDYGASVTIGVGKPSSPDLDPRGETGAISNSHDRTADTRRMHTMGTREMEGGVQDSSTLAEDGNVSIEVQELVTNEQSITAGDEAVTVIQQGKSGLDQNIASTLSTTISSQTQRLDQTQPHQSLYDSRSTPTTKLVSPDPPRQTDSSPQPRMMGPASSKPPNHQPSTSIASDTSQQSFVPQSGSQASQEASICSSRTSEQCQDVDPSPAHPPPICSASNSPIGDVMTSRGFQPRNVTPQPRQYPPQAQSRQQISSSQSPLPKEPLSPHSYASVQPSIQAGPGPERLSKGSGDPPPQPEASRSPGQPCIIGRGPDGVGTPQQSTNSDRQASPQVSPPADHWHPSDKTAGGIYTELDLKNVPEANRKVGDDWYTLFNQQVPRVLDVGLQHTFEHDSIVCCVRFSHDGKYVATGCNRSAQIFDVVSGQKVCVLEDESTVDSVGGFMYVRSVCFSPDGKYLATGSEDKLIRVWDIESRSIRNTFSGHDQDIYSLDFSRDGRIIASGSADRTVRLWDVEAGSQMISLSIEDGINTVAISPDTKYVAASSSRGKNVLVWDIQTGNIVEQLEGPDGHKDGLYSLAFSPDSKYLVTGSLDKTIKLWELMTPGRSTPNSGVKSGKCIRTFKGHRGYVLSVAMTSDGGWVLSGSRDRGVQFWDPRTGSTHLMLLGHKNSIISVTTSPSRTQKGGLFATGSADMKARIWSYSYYKYPQIPPLGPPGKGQVVPNMPHPPPPKSQALQCHQHHITSLSQSSQPPAKESLTVVNCQPVTSKQTTPQNYPQPPQIPPVTAAVPPQYTNNDRQREQYAIIQPSSRPPSSQGNIPRVDKEALQMSNDSREAMSSIQGSEISSQPAAMNASRTGFITRDVAEKTPVYAFTPFQVLQHARQSTTFFLQNVPLWIQTFYHLKDSLPKDEKDLQAHQEQLGKMKDEIHVVEDIYQDLMTRTPEEEREALRNIKERTLATKRQYLEDLDKRCEESLRALQQKRKEMEGLQRLINNLKNAALGLGNAFQEFEVSMAKLPSL